MLNSNGLTNKEVNESRNKYGSNSIDGKNKSTFISLFIFILIYNDVGVKRYFTNLREY